jgi:hypothetical protein
MPVQGKLHMHVKTTMLSFPSCQYLRRRLRKYTFPPATVIDCRAALWTCQPNNQFREVSCALLKEMSRQENARREKFFKKFL